MSLGSPLRMQRGSAWACANVRSHLYDDFHPCGLNVNVDVGQPDVLADCDGQRHLMRRLLQRERPLPLITLAWSAILWGLRIDLLAVAFHREKPVPMHC